MPSTKVLLYGNPSSAQYEQTKKYLDRNSVVYESKNVEDAPEVKSYIESKGDESLPVVVYGEKMWSGFRLDYLSDTAKAIRAHG